MTYRVFDPRPNLKRLMAAPGGLSLETALRRAEAGLESVRGAVLSGLDAKIAQITEFSLSDVPDRADRMYHLANEIFSEAGAFDLVELSAAAHSFCALLCVSEGSRAPAAIRVHVDALRALRSPEVEANPAQRAAVLQGLRAVSERYAKLANREGAPAND